MSWIEYIEFTYPDRDFTDFTVWEIGEIDLKLVYPNILVYQPSFIINTEDCEYLPYKFIHYLKNDKITLWQCNYCTFWSDIFDQRIMELHLLKCQNVIIDLCIL